MAIFKFLKNTKKNEKDYNSFMSQFVREIKKHDLLNESESQFILLFLFNPEISSNFKRETKGFPFLNLVIEKVQKVEFSELTDEKFSLLIMSIFEEVRSNISPELLEEINDSMQKINSDVQTESITQIAGYKEESLFSEIEKEKSHLKSYLQMNLDFMAHIQNKLQRMYFDNVDIAPNDLVNVFSEYDSIPDSNLKFKIKILFNIMQSDFKLDHEQKEYSFDSKKNGFEDKNLKSLIEIIMKDFHSKEISNFNTSLEKISELIELEKEDIKNASDNDNLLEIITNKNGFLNQESMIQDNMNQETIDKISKKYVNYLLQYIEPTNETHDLYILPKTFNESKENDTSLRDQMYLNNSLGINAEIIDQLFNFIRNYPVSLVNIDAFSFIFEQTLPSLKQEIYAYQALSYSYQLLPSDSLKEKMDEVKNTISEIQESLNKIPGFLEKEKAHELKIINAKNNLENIEILNHYIDNLSKYNLENTSFQ